MFRLFFTYLFLFITQLVAAQPNLVPNPSFEELYQCPIAGEFSAMKNWYFVFQSPDVYNSCSIDPIYSETNWIGHQLAFSGNGYVASGLYIKHEDNGLGWPPREAFQVKLTQPLIQGVEYCASMYVSLADSCQYAISNIGMHFGNTDFSSLTIDTSVIFNLHPQVYNDSGNILSDKIHWIKIEGSFVATGGEQFLTIGNFSRPQNMDTLSLSEYSNYGLGYAYYYFDEVEVKLCNYPVVKYTIPNVVTLNDDGINDVFFIQQENISVYTLDIYNRWGTKVGSINNDSPQWDGKYNEKKVSAGTYFYEFVYTNLLGETFQQSGFIQVFN